MEWKKKKWRISISYRTFKNEWYNRKYYGDVVVRWTARKSRTCLFSLERSRCLVTVSGYRSVVSTPRCLLEHWHYIKCPILALMLIFALASFTPLQNRSKSSCWFIRSKMFSSPECVWRSIWWMQCFSLEIWTRNKTDSHRIYSWRWFGSVEERHLPDCHSTNTIATRRSIDQMVTWRMTKFCFY